MSDKICLVDGCDGGGKIVRGMCKMHYQRWRAHGDPDFVMKRGNGIRKHFMYGAWADPEARQAASEATKQQWIKRRAEQ